MAHGRSLLAPASLAAVVVTLLAACREAPAPVSPDEFALEHARHQVSAVSTENPAAYQKQLAALRQATARYHDIATAKAEGWSLQFTPCISNPAGPGAMGYHYVNMALVDAQLDVAQPEALIYEPEANGRMRLVAVEYIVPFSIAPQNGPPPTLYGLSFAPSARFGVWGLHAWVWKNNTSGMHAPYNPDASCANAT